jgi:hypothetical protein
MRVEGVVFYGLGFRDQDVGVRVVKARWEAVLKLHNELLTLYPQIYDF